MPSIPSFDKLLANYPGPSNGYNSPEAVAAAVGGMVQSNYDDPKYTGYKDTCAIRISRSLNYGGDPIPRGGGGISNPYMDHHRIRMDAGGDGKWYIYSTYDLRAYLDGRYGRGKRFSANSTAADLKDQKGIIAFGFVHMDLWDGTKCAYHDDFGHRMDELIIWAAP